MSLQLLVLLPLPIFLSEEGKREAVTKTPTTQQVSPKQDLKMQVVLPELNQVVTASRDKAFDIVWFLSSRLVDQAAGNNGRTPTHCVTADLQENTHT